MESKKTQKKASPQAGAISPDQARIRELEAQVKQLTEIAGRAQADLQNAKMRLEKSADELRKYAAEAFLKRLLPTIDNFQRAFRHLPVAAQDPAVSEWIKGVTAIEQELLRQLTDMGLTKIDALGQPLDPSRHEVLMQGPGEGGTVTEVFEEGYELHGRVLRPAKVKAGDGSPPQSTPQPGDATVSA